MEIGGMRVRRSIVIKSATGTGLARFGKGSRAPSASLGGSIGGMSWCRCPHGFGSGGGLSNI